MIDIPDIVGKLILPGEGIATVDLGPTRDPRLDPMPGGILVDDIVKELSAGLGSGGVGPRTDKRHVSLEDG